MNVQERQAIERRIVTKLVEDALASGLKVSVDNGGDSYEILLSTDKDAILAEMFATDDERLVFSVDDGVTVKRVGDVYLVYGNDGWDVICDHTDTPRFRELMKGANDLADEIEASLP
jgi:hypothetical protein